MLTKTLGQICLCLIVFAAASLSFGSEDVLDRAHMRARVLFFQFEKLKNSQDFYQCGFSGNGPCAKWYDELDMLILQAESYRILIPKPEGEPYHPDVYRLNLFVRDLQNYAEACLRGTSDPRNRELLDFLREELQRNFPPAPDPPAPEPEPAPEPQKEYLLQKTEPGSHERGDSGRLSESEISTIWALVEKDIRRRSNGREIEFLKSPEECIFPLEEKSICAEVPILYRTKKGKRRKTTLAYTITESIQ